VWPSTDGYTVLVFIYSATQVIPPWVDTMSNSKSEGVNRHIARCTSPVFVAQHQQCKLVPGWGLRKRRWAPRYGSYDLRCRHLVFQTQKKSEPCPHTTCTFLCGDTGLLFINKAIPELRSVTCRMGFHTVTCHLTHVNAPRLNLSQIGRYSICLPRRDGRLSWSGRLVTYWDGSHPSKC